MQIYLSLLVALVGLMVYALSSHPKVSELARIAWAVGLLCFLLRIAEVPQLMKG